MVSIFDSAAVSKASRILRKHNFYFKKICKKNPRVLTFLLVALETHFYYSSELNCSEICLLIIESQFKFKNVPLQTKPSFCPEQLDFVFFNIGLIAKVDNI